MADKNIRFRDSGGNHLYPLTKGGNVTNSSGETLGAVEAGAEVNRIAQIKVNGVPAAVVNKIVDIPVPAAVSALPNDAGYVTAQQMAAAIANVQTLKRLKVASLPTENIDPNTIYMVPKVTPQTSNLYTEYMYLDGVWEILGDTAVVLDGYVTEAAIANKADKATTLAGYGITDAVTKSELMASQIQYDVMV